MEFAKLGKSLNFLKVNRNLFIARSHETFAKMVEFVKR
jgi:hypothetical protein